MKLAFDLTLLMILLVFQVSSDSDLIRDSCRNASKDDPNINYYFCVASLEAISNKNSSPPSRLEDLVGMSIQMTKSNATNIVSSISNNLLEDPKFSDYDRKWLQDCYDLYSDSLSDLDEAIEAFKSRHFDSASAKISAVMSASVTCEDQFKDGKEASPLTQDNKTYFELNAMSLAFVQMMQE